MFVADVCILLVYCLYALELVSELCCLLNIKKSLIEMNDGLEAEGLEVGDRGISVCL